MVFSRQRGDPLVLRSSPDPREKGRREEHHVSRSGSSILAVIPLAPTWRRLDADLAPDDATFMEGK